MGEATREIETLKRKIGLLEERRSSADLPAVQAKGPLREVTPPQSSASVRERVALEGRLSGIEGKIETLATEQREANVRSETQGKTLTSIDSTMTSLLTLDQERREEEKTTIARAIQFEDEDRVVKKDWEKFKRTKIVMPLMGAMALLLLTILAKLTSMI